jgi:outer membrane receptor protein involved in Fe transport
LILIDGVRQPGVPNEFIGFGQPDINAIPLHAIDRVETLTGTAGGIYGLDALGGVVNVVLRHDYHGIEVHATTGINSRGDARRLNLEGGVGFTPDDGRTDVSVYVSHAWNQPLLEGQTDLAERGLKAHEKFASEDYAAGAPAGGSAFVTTQAGENLVLKPQYGGASLGSDHSFAPQGFYGSNEALGALFVQHAGQADLSLSPNQQASDIDSTPTTTAAILSIRHRFGGGVEAYVGALILRNHGRYRDLDSTGSVDLSPDSPMNPFQNSVTVSFEGPPGTDYEKVTYASDRYNFGIVAPLVVGWRANLDATFGSARYKNYYGIDTVDTTGLTGINCASIDPFAAPDAIGPALAVCQHTYRASQNAVNHSNEQSLRFAGPAFQTAAGTATLSLTLQNRNERVPPNLENELFDGTHFFDAGSSPYFEGGESDSTKSIYGELEAPLIRRGAGIALIDGLAVQLAVRHDWQTIEYLNDLGSQQQSFSATMYTAGAKFYPAPWLMLRGSYATGQQPPSSNDLEGTVIYSAYTADLIDPERGGAQPDNDDQYQEYIGALKPKLVSARTLSLGMVVNPDGEGRPRISIDYAYTRVAGVYGDPDLDLILANEDMWPERVTRAPLTDEDRAKRYTGGIIQAIDARGLSSANINVKSIDMQLDWRIPFTGGILRAYGSATRQLENRHSGAVVDGAQFVGFIDGPLKWRANVGAEWTRGRTTLGANLQYFGRYRIVGAEYLADASLDEIPQGSRYVRAQSYLDLTISRRFRTFWSGADHEMSLSLGVVNLLDHMPPYREAYESLDQFSPYGDPRQRRFELSLNANF